MSRVRNKSEKEQETVYAKKSCRFGTILKRLREAKGVSGRKLARLARLSESSISHYENGLKVPRVKAINSIAKVLSVPSELISWFAYTSNEPGKPFRKVDSMMLSYIVNFERKCSRETTRDYS